MGLLHTYSHTVGPLAITPHCSLSSHPLCLSIDHLAEPGLGFQPLNLDLEPPDAELLRSFWLYVACTALELPLVNCTLVVGSPTFTLKG